MQAPNKMMSAWQIKYMAADTQPITIQAILTSDCVQASTFVSTLRTMASTSTTDSRDRADAYLTMGLLTVLSSLNKMACTGRHNTMDIITPSNH